MLRRLPVAILAAVSVALALPARADDVHIRKHVRHWHGYGFLPGYEPPERPALSSPHYDAPHYWYFGGRYYFGGPHVFRGRWNGGSYGPCWTSTPIGLMWNCG